jgi:membrane complex biogenesis BtpA family protein
MRMPSLFGMVHLLPLPGSPRYGGDLKAVIARAVEDAETLARAGFPALIVENLGDAPFFKDEVPAISVAGITAAAVAVGEATGLPLGINVLRNDALAALAIAAVTGASFVRVNVLTGTMFTDQGLIEGRAAEVARSRAELCPEVLVLADVFVKHATPAPGADLGAAARDTFERGGADALIVSGEATGAGADLREIGVVRAAVPDAPLLVGSGVTADNLAPLADSADGAVVGSSLKRETLASPVDFDLAAALVEAARTAGWL